MRTATSETALLALIEEQSRTNYSKRRREYYMTLSLQSNYRFCKIVKRVLFVLYANLHNIGVKMFRNAASSIWTRAV